MDDDMKEFISEVESIDFPFIFNIESEARIIADLGKLLSRFYQQDKLSQLLIPGVEYDRGTLTLKISTQDGKKVNDIRPYFTKPARVLNG